jgi:hypothetical protein
MHTAEALVRNIRIFSGFETQYRAEGISVVEDQGQNIARKESSLLPSRAARK